MVRRKDIQETARFEVTLRWTAKPISKRMAGGDRRISFCQPFPRRQSQSHFDRRERLPAVILPASASLAPLELSNTT
jgi:hypothetical protein